MIPDYFQLWFLYKNDLHNSSAGKQEKLTELNTFNPRKEDNSSTLLIRLRYQGYRWESDFAIFGWRVIWNYAYSPNLNILWFL